MRLIDADVFRRELDNHFPFTKEEQSRHGIADIAKSTVLFVLNKTPIVDAVPVAHSEWIPKEKADTPYGLEMECAKCGFSVIVNDALYFNFCPNCGARMDERDGDQHEEI